MRREGGREETFVNAEAAEFEAKEDAAGGDREREDEGVLLSWSCGHGCNDYSDDADDDEVSGIVREQREVNETRRDGG